MVLSTYYCFGQYIPIHFFLTLSLLKISNSIQLKIHQRFKNRSSIQFTKQSQLQTAFLNTCANWNSAGKTVRLKKYINNNKNTQCNIYIIQIERDFDCIVADRKVVCNVETSPVIIEGNDKHISIALNVIMLSNRHGKRYAI